MIIDTSALVAILTSEAGSEALIEAVCAERGGIPAPVSVEFLRVAGNQRFRLRQEAGELLASFERRGSPILPFTQDHARIAVSAEPLYGAGNGNGGSLNLLDLMIYAVAKERDDQLLCTGKDFARTDVQLHPASRPW